MVFNIILNLIYRDIGPVFSDGNILFTLANFPTEHICNMFCKIFKLSSMSSEDLSYTDDESGKSKIAEEVAIHTIQIDKLHINNEIIGIIFHL